MKRIISIEFEPGPEQAPLDRRLLKPMPAKDGRAEGESGITLSAPRQDLVGTAEVAELLDVERPRIGRWIRRGIMPKTVADLAATPVWERRQILAMLPWVEEHRRSTKTRGNNQYRRRKNLDA